MSGEANNAQRRAEAQAAYVSEVASQHRKGELEGLRIGVLVRVSTPKQVGNWSYQDQDTRLNDLIVRLGGTPTPYDENRDSNGQHRKMSGRDLSKRDVALQLLEDIDAGRLDGMAGWDAKRITRDPFLADSGTITKRLSEAKAVLVTIDHIYELWRTDDLFRWNIEATIAARDVLDIRNTFFRGLFSRASREPFLLGVPPIGYRRGRVEEHQGDAIRSRWVPEKDPDAAAFMGDFVAWCEEYQTAGQVARAANQKYRDWLLSRCNRPRKVGGWRPRNIVIILQNPLYAGEWRYGRVVRYADHRKIEPRSNTLWDIDQRRERAERRGEFQHQAPELAYWTAAKARVWLAKFQPRLTAGRRQIRASKHEHPFLGVLYCPTCDRPMVGSGRSGYICPAADGRLCAAPGHLTDPPVIRLLREAFPGALAQAQVILTRADQEDAGQHADQKLAALRRRHAALTERLDRIAEHLYGERLVSEAERKALQAQMADIGLQADAAKEQLESLEVAAKDNQEASESLRIFLDSPPALLDKMKPEKQAAVYRRLFEHVQIVGQGRGVGRKHTLLPTWRVNARIVDKGSTFFVRYLRILQHERGVGEQDGGYGQSKG